MAFSNIPTAGQGQEYSAPAPQTMNFLGLPVASQPFSAEFALQYANFMRDDTGRQMDFQSEQNQLDRQFQSLESERNRAVSIAQQLDATTGAFAQLMTESGRTAALQAYEPTRNYYQNLMSEGMFSQGQIDRMAAGQYENVGRGLQSSLQQAANAARAGGARSAGALALASNAINAQALGQMGKVRTDLETQNAQSKIAGAQGAAGIAAQEAALLASPTQESATQYYQANSPLNALLAQTQENINQSSQNSNRSTSRRVSSWRSGSSSGTGTRSGVGWAGVR